MRTEEDINLYYNGFKQALHARNYDRAAGFLHMMYMSINFHPSIISQVTFEPLVQREFVRFMDLYVRTFPDDPVGYLLKMSYYRNKGRIDFARKIWVETCQNAVKGFHYQPGVSPSIFDAEKGQTFTSIGGMGLGAKAREGLEALKVNLLADVGGETVPSLDQEIASEIAVETCAGEFVGLNAVALNGSLSGFDVPTRYHFRYGYSADGLTHTSIPRDMPAGRNGVVCDAGENFFRRLNCFASGVQFISCNDTTDASSMAVKLDWPFGKDRNHLDGIGIIDLFMGWQNQAQTRGQVEGAATQTSNFPTLNYYGEETDLRDAQVQVTYRTSDLNPKDFAPVIWLHGRTGTASFPDDWDDIAAWAVTNDQNPDRFVADGAWHDITFDLPALSSVWTFCGSNIEEMGSGMERYTYAPIQDLQRDNVGGNICIAFVHGQDLDTPEGAVDIARLEMAYRSRSLLAPGQGAALISRSESGKGAPENLVNGTIGDLSACYIDEMTEGSCIDLVWALRGDADITSFKLHQCALAPAKDIEIAVSGDGADFSVVWSGTLDDVPENPADWGAFAQNTGLIRAIVLPEKSVARFIRLRVLSGYREGCAGLDAFEAFGEGLAFIPSPEMFTLSEKIDDLEPGKTVFAQLVAENEQGLFEGDVVEIARPEKDVPVIMSASVSEQNGDEAIFRARTIAMGHPSRLTVTLMPETGEPILIKDISIGQWHVPRDVKIRVRGLVQGGRYDITCQAENDIGPSESYTFTFDAA